MKTRREYGPIGKNYVGKNYRLSNPKEEEIITFHGKEVDYHSLYGYNKKGIPCIVETCNTFAMSENKFLPVIRYTMLNGYDWEEKEEIFHLEGDFDFSLEEFYAWLLRRSPLMQITSSSSLKRLEDKRRESVNRLNKYIENSSLLRYRINPHTDWFLGEGFDHLIMGSILREFSEVFFHANEKMGIHCTRFEYSYIIPDKLKVTEEGQWLINYIIPLLLKTRRLDQMVKDKKKELE